MRNGECADADITLLVVDGFADLDPDGRPGLGARAHAEFGVPVIGVAKSPFRAGHRGRSCGHASRRLSTQNVTARRMAASITKMPVSMPWNAQNLLAGW
jgi:deoxyribonuclease V